ncbi:MAG: methylated-DNA--[protein]-cysteine S-methyltransferase [Balneolaceae bacterium]
MKSTLYVSRIETKLGSMVAGVTEQAVLFLEFQKGNLVERKLELLHQNITLDIQINRKGLHDEIQQQMDEYFSGMRTDFDLPLQTVGTKFQSKVWNLLLTVPAGQTISYTDAAGYLSEYYTAEDVASSASSNHIMLLVPCHRLVGKDGSLVGYSGGLDRKKRLLEHEKDLTGISEVRDVTSNVS